MGSLSFPDNLPPGWKNLLQEEKEKPYFSKLVRFVRGEQESGKKIFPDLPLVLRALQDTDIDAVRVVILGQDPYHGDGQAMGRSFAVPVALQKKPPSLINIFKEIESDMGAPPDRRGTDLSGWASQGVLLLNTVLTVRAHEPFSHRDKGWEEFTDSVIRHLNARERPLVFMLWGAPARQKKTLLDLNRHIVLEAPHPSPLSAHRGFFGCRHFSKANEAIRKIAGAKEVDWLLTGNECHQ